MEQKTNKKNKVFQIILDVIFGFIIVLCLFVSISSLVAKANGGVANLFGSAPTAVRTKSMTGTINKGDLIFIKLISFEEDGTPSVEFVPNETIAAFRYDINKDGTLQSDEIITHKFIGMDGTTYLFQGTYVEREGAELEIQQVTYNQIIGVYQGQRIAWLGEVSLFLKSSVGFLVIFVLPIFVFFCYKGYRLFITYNEVKRENALETAKMTDEQKEAEKTKIREEVLKELQESKEEKKD